MHAAVAAAVMAFARPPVKYDSCVKTSVADPQLCLGIAALPDPTFGTNESLAGSICCDTRFSLYAEPRGLYQQIGLFKSLDKGGVTTFYDAACGLPLFRAPLNRSWDDFVADTTEHGWPSFRDGEVTQHVRTNSPSAGLVTSSCGTHLGSYLPDEHGARWCIDLSCVAGAADWMGCCSSCQPGATGCEGSPPAGKCAAPSEGAPATRRCDCSC